MRARGERNGGSRLTEAQVLEIRRLYAEGDATRRPCGRRKSESVTQMDLALDYNVSQTVICSIVRRKSWTHI